MMKKRVIFLSNLRPDADREAYERFLREVDYPTTKKLLPVSYYQATRLEGRLMSDDAPGYSYAEVLDIDDYDLYRSAVASPEGELKDLFGTIFSFIDDKNYFDGYGHVIE